VATDTGWEEYVCVSFLSCSYIYNTSDFRRHILSELTFEQKSVVKAKAALKIRDIVGQVQHGRGGFGLSLAPPKWQKAGPAQRRKLVVNEVRKQEERMRCIKAISQAKQGECMRWESV